MTHQQNQVVKVLAGVIVGRGLVTLQLALDDGWSIGGKMRKLWAGNTTDESTLGACVVVGKFNLLFALERKKSK